jgi:hypothetical protein
MKIYIEYIFVIREVNSVMCDIAWRSRCNIQFFEHSEIERNSLSCVLTDVGYKSYIYKLAIGTKNLRTIQLFMRYEHANIAV